MKGPKTQRNRKAREISLLALASAAVVVFGFRLTNRLSPVRTTVASALSSTGSDAPLRIGPLAPVLFGKESAEAEFVERMLRAHQPGPVSLSYCCHLLRLYGWGGMPGPHFMSGREVLAALTDSAASERCFGEPVFFLTRSGIRYRPLERSFAKTRENARGTENHRDICLATFAEAGLPLSAKFTTPERAFQLRDLLRDSVENFHLGQEELPWTAVAYALYASPGPVWANRFGEVFEWDALTEALLAAPFQGGSCGGTHLLYALTLIRRVEGTNRPLGSATHVRLDGRLKAVIASACVQQATDGHWLTDWWVDAADEAAAPRRPGEDSVFARLLITSHLLECLTLEPPELQPPAEVYRRAAQWLCRVLRDGKTVNESSVCPRTHAVCAVRNLVEAHRK